MPSKRRLVVAAIAISAVLLGLLGLVLTIDFDSPELGRAILERAGRQGGLELSAEGFRLNLLRGLELERATVRGDLPGGRLEGTVERLVLRHRPMSLLSGTPVIDEIVFQGPVIELVSPASESAGEAESPSAASPPAADSSPAESPPAEDEVGSGAGPAFAIERFAVTGGHLALRDAEGTSTEIHGFDLEFHEIASDSTAPSFLAGFQATGRLSADEIITSTTRAKDVTGTVSMADGRLRIEELVLPAEQGRLVASEVEVDLMVEPYRYRVKASGDPLDTNLILGAGKDGSFGPARLELEVIGDGSADGNLTGMGRLSLDTGELPGLPVLAELERLYQGTQVIGATYDPFEIRFGLVGSRLEIEPFTVKAGELTLAVEGRVGLEGSLELHLALAGPRENIKVAELPEEVLEALTDAEGRLNLPVLIRGSAEAPAVGFDRRGWEKMLAKRVEKELEKELGKALGKLFGGDG